MEETKQIQPSSSSSMIIVDYMDKHYEVGNTDRFLSFYSDILSFTSGNRRIY